MLVASVKSKKKLCHSRHCVYAQKIRHIDRIKFESYAQAKQNGFIFGVCCIHHRTYADEVKAEVADLCPKYGLDCRFDDRRVFIRSRYSQWYFDITGEYIRLMHENANRAYRSKGDYHCQFKRKISISELIMYIAAHERKKYETVPRIFTLLEKFS